MKWKKVKPTSTDKALQRNGAYKPPPAYHLMDGDRIAARLKREADGWRYWLPGGSPSAPFVDVEAAKAAALKRVEAAA